MERNRKLPTWVVGVVSALWLYQPSGTMAAEAGMADAISADPGSAVVLSEPASDRSKLLDMIAGWLAMNYDLPRPDDLPDLVVTAPERLAVLRYGPDADPAYGDDLVAVYSDSERRIYLAPGWDPATPAGLSAIVHEMVHHLQNAAGMRHACPGEREALAYAAQEDWLGLFARSLESEFGIDRGTRKLLTMCMY